MLAFQVVGGRPYFGDRSAVRLRTPRLPDLIALALLAFVVAASSGCTRAPAAEEVSENLRTKVASVSNGTAVVRNEGLLERKTVSSFYEKRKYRRAWDLGSGDADRVVEAIRGVERDGLDPKDYHLEAIEALIRERKEGANADLDANLDLLLTDAVAAMVDDVRYGRVRPSSLNPKWNVNPREGAPPLNEDLEGIVGSRDLKQALESRRHDHFIYHGLVGALEQLRTIAANGGWPKVTPGKTIKPGAVDSRIPAVRARLAATGELPEGSDLTSTRYDPALRKAVELFQSRHRLDATGVIGKETMAAMNVSAAQRVEQVRVNLERARWVLGGLTSDFMLVNLPAFKAYLIRGGSNVWEARTMIGQEARQTPSFRARMQTVVFNPDWTVPPTILEEDIIKGIQEGRDMIREKGVTVLDSDGNEVDPSSIDWSSADPDNFPYTLRQPPGDDNALGRLKFEFPNPYLIYLHDTPSKSLFESDKRTFSSGCIRIENPMELAEQLLGPQGWDRSRIQEMIDAGETKRVAIENQIPILIVYWTVSVGKSGEVRYMQDIYDLDRPLLTALDGSRQSSTALGSR
ncbi:MAG TPA: L,D-transpeptidase family protein [Candidatus Eisenbacteria bacterium]|nr:L,D-transpeptidase family protein [Candidatus Eisenbacteria bacterium]